MIGPGKAIFYRGSAYDVLKTTKSGDILVRHCINQEEIWIDYFATGFTDPYSSPGALLEALSMIKGDEQ